MSAQGKIIIAGAGLGGLAAAACLLEAGFDVEVYEQAPALGEIGAGIQQSANSTHVMRHLGILDRLLAVAYRPPLTRYHIFNSGEVLREQVLAEAHEQRYGGPYLQMHRADFHAILAERVRELKADAIHLNATAVGVDETPRSAILRLADGGRAEGDLVVAADGIKSVIRRQVADPRPPQYTGDSAWRLTVPTERLPENFLDGTFSIWVGPAKHAVVYFVRGGALLNFVGAVELDEWIDESWTLRRPWEELKADFEGWHPDIQAIIDAVDREECYRWALNVHPALDNWSTERTTLLGDAAHPTLPYLAQGAAMSVEDAAVLTRALQQSSSVAAALKLYQYNRMARTARIVEESQRNRKLFHIETVEELKTAFAERPDARLNQERADWLYSYNPLTVELQPPP